MDRKKRNYQGQYSWYSGQSAACYVQSSSRFYGEFDRRYAGCIE